MRCFSLFSGIGGFDLAFQRHGHEIVGGCEIDEYARTIYARHFPGIKIWRNATEIDPKEIPDHDVFCAGFPCQAFSVAGKRVGFGEQRGTLFFEIARIARQKRPKFLLLENVLGLLNHDNGRTFAHIIATLDEMGYDAEWQVINSKYFVPQNRERIFIIGHLRTERGPQIFPLGNFNKETTKNKPRINVLQDSSHDTNRVYSIDGIARTLRANSGGMGSKTGLYSMENKIKTLGNKNPSGKGQSGTIYDPSGLSPTLPIRADKITIKTLGNKNPSGKGQSGMIYDPSGLSPALQAGTGKHQNSQGYIAVTRDHNKIRPLDTDQANCITSTYYKGPDNHGMRTLIMLSNKTSNTKNRIQNRDSTWALTANSNDFGIVEQTPKIVADRSRKSQNLGRNIESPKDHSNSLTSVMKDNLVLKNSRLRRLTPLECERLQGFPDGWTSGISDTQRYKTLGNAVTVPVIEYIISNFIDPSMKRG